MEDTNVPEHVFISYAKADREHVARIAADLREAGIPVWIDEQRLAAGTRDWDSAIRDAIERSYAVVLLASPAARQSLAVDGELALAESKKRVICPVWVTGNQWIDCVPLTFSRHQYLDCRSENYRSGLLQTIERLQEVILASTPPHRLVNLKTAAAAHAQTPGARALSWRGVRAPHSVQIAFPGVQAWDGWAVSMNLLAHATLEDLLDSLYVNYLRDHFTPFSYGSTWVLMEESALYGLVLVDWSWLTCTNRADYQPPLAFRKMVPSQSPLARQSVWYVIETRELSALGLALLEKELLWAYLWDLKGTNYVHSIDLLERIEIESLDPDDYELCAVVGKRGNPANDGPVVWRQRALLTQLQKERIFRHR